MWFQSVDLSCKAARRWVAGSVAAAGLGALLFSFPILAQSARDESAITEIQEVTVTATRRAEPL